MVSMLLGALAIPAGIVLLRIAISRLAGILARGEENPPAGDRPSPHRSAEASGMTGKASGIGLRSNLEEGAVSVTVTISDDLAKKLRPYEAQVPEILELGLREWCARGEPGYSGISDVLEALAGLPTPEEVLALRPAPPLQDRITDLLEKSRTAGLSADEQREWDRYKFIEHLVRLAKANAARKIKDRNGS